jgi:hypothetical protein
VKGGKIGALKRKKDKTMKKLSYPIIAALAGLFIASANESFAGGTDGCCSATCCNMRTAASPKVHATLNERCASKCAPASQTASTIMPNTAVAGSPKTQQMRNENAPANVAPTQTAGSVAADGIAASPKVRSQLEERHQTVEIAPLK